MEGAFCVTLPVLRPVTDLCTAANADFTWASSGCRIAEADAAAASKLVFTFAIAACSAGTPSLSGLTWASALSEAFTALTSAQPPVEMVVEAFAAMDGLGPLLPPQPASAPARAKTTNTSAAGLNRELIYHPAAGHPVRVKCTLYAGVAIRCAPRSLALVGTHVADPSVHADLRGGAGPAMWPARL